MALLSRISELSRNEKGVAAIEFALVLPVLLMMSFGGFELSRYILVSHKLEKAAYTVSDVVAQQTSVTQSQLDKIMIAATEIMSPYTIGENGVVILSSVYQNGTVNPPVVQWQYRGGGTLPAASEVGTAGNWATLPDNLPLNDKDNIIVAEIFYKFTPVFSGGVIKPAELHKVAIFKPRLGALTTAPN